MKVLVLGAAGMLGHQVWLKCLQEFGPSNVGGTLRKSAAHYERFGIFEHGQIYEHIDISDFDQTQNVLESFRPSHIINCIGLTLRKPELQDFEKCVDINSMLPHRLAIWGLNNNAKVVHFSTDCVFDGKLGPYRETDQPTAKDLYGKSKFLGEISYKNSLTLRLSIVGRELEGKTELIEWFLSQKNKTVNGFSEAWYSGMTTNYVATEVLRLIEHYPTLSGVYQIASEPISKYEILQILNEHFHVGAKIEKSANFRSNKVLDSTMYEKITGFKKPTWKKMLLDLSMENKVNYDL